MRAIRNIGVGEFSRPQMDRAINEERDSFRDPETRGYRFGGRKIFVNESFFSRKRIRSSSSSSLILIYEREGECKRIHLGELYIYILSQVELNIKIIVGQ